MLSGLPSHAHDDNNNKETTNLLRSGHFLSSTTPFLPDCRLEHQLPAMVSIVALVTGGIASTYLFLRLLLRLTQDTSEPPALLTSLPFIRPLIGMIREKTKFHIRLR